MKRTLQIVNGVALVATIVMNYLSNTGAFNGNTMKTVSDRYHNYFTPAGYAFSIWGLIYLGLLGFVIYTGRELFTSKTSEDAGNDYVLKIGWWFFISCVCNSFWVVAWLYDYIGLSVILMLILFFSLLKIVVDTRMELDFHPFKKYLFIFWPFAIYAGWITVALIADIAAWLTKINWNGWNVPAVTWAVIMIVIAAVVNLLMIFSRNLREYGAVAIWALVAIAVANKGESPMVAYASYTAAAIIFIAIVMNAAKTFRQRSVHSM